MCLANKNVKRTYYMATEHQISIIIPTYNEQDNITPLVKRLHHAMTSFGIKYELIFIDDHSLDDTCAQIANFTSRLPIRVELKRGKRGKAQSLAQGFASAKYSTIAMIDADLQYPPEAIPHMFARLKVQDTDIVVARRTNAETSKLRQLTSKVFRSIVGKLIWKLDVDVQSDLKVFKREILERVIWSLKVGLLI